MNVRREYTLAPRVVRTHWEVISVPVTSAFNSKMIELLVSNPETLAWGQMLMEPVTQLMEDVQSMHPMWHIASVIPVINCSLIPRDFHSVLISMSVRPTPRAALIFAKMFLGASSAAVQRATN